MPRARRFARLTATALALALPPAALAQSEISPTPDAAPGATLTPAACVAHVEGADRAISFDAPGAALGDGALAPGAPALAECDPLTVLRHLTPDLAQGEREAFCLVRETAEDGALTVAGFSEGPRDEMLGCTDARGFCERVNASRDAALEIAGLSEDAGLAENAGAAADGVRSLRDRAGATILTGSGSAVASTLGNLSASAMAAVTAPAAIAAGVVSVVAVGGAVYVCR